VATLGNTTAVVGGAARHPVTLLDLWATWCGQCIAEFAELERLHHTYGPRGLRTLAVSVDKSEAAGNAFVMARGSSFAIGFDPLDRLRQKVAADRSLPKTWLVGVDGRILWTNGSEIPNDTRSLEMAIEAALRGQ